MPDVRHRLRYQSHLFDLPDGEFVVGRSDECQLSVDDPQVSRKHAVINVSGDIVTVSDLGSRNGVRVNGALIERTVRVVAGDLITIGGQEVTVLLREVDSAPPPQTARFDSLRTVGDLARKALALGRADEAERLLSGTLERVLEAASDDSVEAVRRATDLAIELAAATGRGQWFDYVIRVYSRLGRPCPAETVDRLYQVVRQAASIDRSALREYVASLRAAEGAYGPAERFVIGRLEGLERLVALR